MVGRRSRKRNENESGGAPRCRPVIGPGIRVQVQDVLHLRVVSRSAATKKVIADLDRSRPWAGGSRAARMDMARDLQSTYCRTMLPVSASMSASRAFTAAHAGLRPRSHGA